MPADLPVLVLAEAGAGVAQLLGRRVRQRLERQVLPRFFRAQAWFLDRYAAVTTFRLAEMQSWTVEGGSWLLTTVAVTLAGGTVHIYAVPLALVWEGEDDGRTSALLPATLAKVRMRARMGLLVDAAWDDRFLLAFVAAIEGGGTFPFGKGTLEFSATGAHPGLTGAAGPSSITRNVSEHGQTRVNVDDRLWLKGYRWLLEGTHPELELSRFLTETAKFPHIPQLAGTVEFVGPEGQRSTLAIVERYMENQGDAWTYTINYLERHLDAVRATPEPADQRHTVYIALMKTLGQRTAEFHRALALPDEAGAFGSERIGPGELGDWAGRVRRAMEEMYDLLEQEAPRLPEAAQAMAASLLAVRTKLYWRIQRAAVVRLEAMKTRYHGDYMLGQVWLTGNDLLIANYGGEPGLPWGERRRKHTPLRDVGSMLYSLSDAGAAVLEPIVFDSAEAAAALTRQVDEWERLARRAFFRSYRQGMSGHLSCPSSPAAAEALATLSLVELGTANVSRALARHSTTVASAMRRLIRVAQRGR